MKVLFLVPNLRASNGVASFALNYFRNMDPGEVHIDFALYQDRASPYYGEIRERGCEIFIEMTQYATGFRRLGNIRKFLSR